MKIATTKESVFRYGENNRGLGILSFPVDTNQAPIVVALNAGLLHRAEPYRLNVLACRQLAQLGYIALRVDLSGKGDTPARAGLNNHESVTQDWSFIKQGLVKRFGERRMILLGLCSGADNGIKLSIEDPDVQGLVLLDPVSLQDAGFRKRALCNKLTNPHKWSKIHQIIFKKLKQVPGKKSTDTDQQIILRDIPTKTENQLCFQRLVERNGRVLAVFTSHAFSNYNQEGQFVRALGIAGLAEICEEVFWPQMLHLYPAQTHRDQLLARIREWALAQLPHFQNQKWT